MKGERLSSIWTGVYRFAALPVWIGLGALGFAALSAGVPERVLYALAGFWLGVAFFLLWLATVLVNVALEGEELVVSRGRRAERIALRDVEAVSGLSVLDPELVWIRLRRPVGFGSRIVFIPRRRGFRPFSQHPVVGQLSERITQNETPGRPPPLEWESGATARAVPRIAFAVVALAALGLLVAGVLRLATGSASPYHAAIEAARAHPLLAAELGEPIEADWPVDARVHWGDDSAATDFVVPLAGPRARGQLYVRAHWQDGEWSFSVLRAVLEDGRALDLLDTGPAPPEPLGELL